MQRRFKLIPILLILTKGLYLGQSVVKFYSKDSTSYYLLQSNTPTNKTIPPNYKEAIQMALTHYPELQETNIKFRIKKKLAPLAARPRTLSIFRKPAKRKYIVTISSSTIKMLCPILLQNLSFNAQVGVLGHELAHVSEYHSKGTFFFIKLVFKHIFNKRAIDRFEYNTDQRSIEHGLGFQLLSWSEEVRQKLNLNKWGGANKPNTKRERYMNPETIITVMKSLSIY
jgi:hypothetical protein